MDFSPLVNDLVGVVAAVVTACVPIATGYLIHKVGLDKDTALRDSLNTAIQNSIGVALAAGQRVGDAALSNVAVKNVGVAAMASYVIANAPDAIQHFGLTPDDIAAKAANALAKHFSTMTPVPAAPAKP